MINPILKLTRLLKKKYIYIYQSLPLSQWQFPSRRLPEQQPSPEPMNQDNMRDPMVNHDHLTICSIRILLQYQSAGEIGQASK